MKLLILALSYFLVFLVNSLYDVLPIYSYYLLSAGSSFILYMLCIVSKDKLIAGYAIVQLVALIVYVHMIPPQGFYAIDNFMYGGVINYANSIILYEVLLFGAGLKDVYNAMHRYNNDNYMHSYRNKRDY